MIASDLWAVLSRATSSARVVLRCEGGVEIDVAEIEHFAGLVVITPDGEVDEVPVDAESRIEAAEAERDEAREELRALKAALDPLVTSLEAEVAQLREELAEIDRDAEDCGP